MYDFKLICSYTRKQAIEDGVLVDITKSAMQVGFKIHTVITWNLYTRYISPPAGLDGYGQSVEGRLYDVLWLAVLTARSNAQSSRMEFDVLFQMAPGEPERVRVVADIGPGDHGEPVLTIMLPGDD